MTSDEAPYQILGNDQETDKWQLLDLSQERLSELGIDPVDNDALSTYIYNGSVRYGGYGEHRSIYTRSSQFSGESESRCIHLGVDIWAAAGTEIYSPWNGSVLSAHNNAGIGDYGPTLIIEYKIKGKNIYGLFGHLNRESLEIWRPGDVIKARQVIAEMGSELENGGWPPHLHLQMIYSLGRHQHDYPGVCAESKWLQYSANCPNPLDFLEL